MTAITVAAVAANFGRDLDDAFARIGAILADARERGAGLVVLPEATLGGYLADLGGGAVPLPPALDLDGPEVRKLAALAGDLVVTAGLCEADGDARYNTAVAVNGDGVLGVHRKVHQPLGEGASYAAGDRFDAFDTPVGRLGMMICYDKAFPEAARALALDGAEIVACMSAWPAARHQRHTRSRRRSLDPPVRPVRPGPRAGEPGVVGLGEPVRHVRVAAVRGQRQGGGRRR